MTNEEILAARKICQRALAAQWKVVLGFNRFHINPGPYGAYIEFDNYANVLASSVPAETREFICAARTLVPQLLDEVEKLKELLGVDKWDMQKNFEASQRMQDEIEKELQSARTRISELEAKAEIAKEALQEVVAALSNDFGESVVGDALPKAREVLKELEDLEQGKK